MKKLFQGLFGGRVLIVFTSGVVLRLRGTLDQARDGLDYHAVYGPYKTAEFKPSEVAGLVSCKWWQRLPRTV